MDDSVLDGKIQFHSKETEVIVYQFINYRLLTVSFALQIVII